MAGRIVSVLFQEGFVTKAEEMLSRWLNDTAPIEDVITFAKEIDPEVIAFLGTLFIFSDGSRAELLHGCLKIRKD